MTTNFTFKVDGVARDFDELFVRRSLFSQGGLWTWGKNSYGHLGDNTIVNKSSPVQTIAAGVIWKQASAGGYSDAAIKTDGTLWMWGSNAYGQLGDNTIVKKSSPVQTVSAGTNWKQVAGGNSHTAAIKTDGTLWLWGRNSAGQLGVNSIVAKSSPVQTVSGGTTWKQVSGGDNHIAAIKTDGTLWMWGANSNGQLGDNTSAAKSSPVQTVSGGTTWKQVGGGNNHTAAIKTDGTLWMWGLNNVGQLGNNTITSQSSPIQTVSGGTTWKQVAGGINTTAAIKTDGTLWTWGVNTYGRLGDNTNTNKSSPVQTVAGGTNWKQVAAGYAHLAAIKTDGTLWLWGRNDVGQLGDNTQTHRSSPVQTVAGGTNWKQVNIGNSTAAITDIFP